MVEQHAVIALDELHDQELQHADEVVDDGQQRGWLAPPPRKALFDRRGRRQRQEPALLDGLTNVLQPRVDRFVDGPHPAMTKSRERSGIGRGALCH